MEGDLPLQRVEVTFAGAPRAHRFRQALGVNDVEVYGSALRCTVFGTLQPFFEARGATS